MTATHHVLVAVPFDSFSLPANSFDEAVEKAVTEMQKPGLRFVSVIGDDYDCDSDADGYFCCDDGLTEAERDVLEARGIS